MNIKKIFTVLAASVAGSILVSSSAVANDVKFYIGGNASYGNLSKSSFYSKQTTSFANPGKFKKATKSIGMLLGAKFHENVGAELGYSHFFKSKLVGYADATQAADRERSDRLSASNMHLDVVGFLPVMDQLNLLGSVGLGKFKTKIDTRRDVDAVVLNTTKTNKVGLRAGLGAEYSFDCVGVRLMAGYQKTGGKADQRSVKNLKTIGLGVNYYFM